MVRVIAALALHWIKHTVHLYLCLELNRREHRETILKMAYNKGHETADVVSCPDLGSTLAGHETIAMQSSTQAHATEIHSCLVEVHQFQARSMP